MSHVCEGRRGHCLLPGVKELPCFKVTVPSKRDRQTDEAIRSVVSGDARYLVLFGLSPLLNNRVGHGRQGVDFGDDRGESVPSDASAKR